MPPSGSDMAYPVLVTRHANGFELRIQELLVVVYATRLEDGWRRLLERKQQVIDCATAAGRLDDLPSPGPLPPLVGPDFLRWM